MIRNWREEVVKPKQEGDVGDGKFLKPLNSRQWSAGFRNPRIVRVSRSFGGKDRHSKVCTSRGLRDRRIRLSVPTAIQLYELMDRLGLGQPSKVIDWLLEATKHDIDKLPPLQFPQGFGEFHPQPLRLPYESSASQFRVTPSGSFFDTAVALRVRENLGFNAKSKYWDMDFLSRAKDTAEEGRGFTSEKGKRIKSTEDQENQDEHDGNGSRLSGQKIFHIANESPLSGILNQAIPYGSYHSDPSNLCLSQFGSRGTLSYQSELNNGNTAVPLPSTLSVPSGSQFYFCPSVNAAVPSVIATYPPYISTPLDSDPRLLSHFQLLSSSSQVLPPSLASSTYTNTSPLAAFPTQLSAKLLGSETHNQSQLDKDKAGGS